MHQLAIDRKGCSSGVTYHCHYPVLVDHVLGRGLFPGGGVHFDAYVKASDYSRA